MPTLRMEREEKKGKTKALACRPVLSGTLSAN